MNRAGFTLIELVMVIVLLGILAVYAAPKLGSISTVKASAFADKLRADIRYAQTLAMSSGMRYRIYVNTAPSPASGYAVVNDSNADGWGTTGAGEYAKDPSGSGNLSVTLNTGDYTGITISPAATIEFDSLGKPTLGGGTVLTVSPGGATVTITAQTGAVN